MAMCLEEEICKCNQRKVTENAMYTQDKVESVIYNNNTMLYEDGLEPIKAGSCSCGCAGIKGAVPFVIFAAMN